MAYRKLCIVLIVVSAGACVDRIDLITEFNGDPVVVIDGHISDEPGPYTIKVSQGFDIQSKTSPKIPISVRRMVISDDLGNSEDLSPTEAGVYQTKPGGIQGKIGRVYKLRIELLDSRIYESLPDTLYPAGNVDSVYVEFGSKISSEGSPQYGFDILFNASSGNKGSKFFLWDFLGTFQAETNPEFQIDEPCSYATCDGCNPCNYKPLCSGIRNVSPYPDLNRAVFERVAPCTCCTCWFNFTNNNLVVSDDQYLSKGRFTKIFLHHVPLDQWIFQHKVYVDVIQFSLSRQSFEFWKSIKLQKQAINSLFQPVTGKIPNNFKQLSGTPNAIQGIFYSTAKAHRSTFIERKDVPDQRLIPPVSLTWNKSCLSLFPNGTTSRPFYWKD